jgi:hypothetical protein
LADRQRPANRFYRRLGQSHGLIDVQRAVDDLRGVHHVQTTRRSLDRRRPPAVIERRKRENVPHPRQPQRDHVFRRESGKQTLQGSDELRANFLVRPHPRRVARRNILGQINERAAAEFRRIDERRHFNHSRERRRIGNVDDVVAP